MPAKKPSGRKWTAAQKAAHSKKIKKALRAKKNGKAFDAFKAAHAAKGTIVVDSAEVLRVLVRKHIAVLLPAIIEEEVRSALS